MGTYLKRHNQTYKFIETDEEKYYIGKSDVVRKLSQQMKHCITKLDRLPVTVQHLQETGVGRTVNALRKYDGEVGNSAKAIVAKWKAMVAAEDTSDDEPSSTTNEDKPRHHRRPDDPGPRRHEESSDHRQREDSDEHRERVVQEKHVSSKSRNNTPSSVSSNNHVTDHKRKANKDLLESGKKRRIQDSSDEDETAATNSDDHSHNSEANDDDSDMLQIEDETSEEESDDSSQKSECPDSSDSDNTSNRQENNKPKTSSSSHSSSRKQDKHKENHNERSKSNNKENSELKKERSHNSEHSSSRNNYNRLKEKESSREKENRREKDGRREKERSRDTDKVKESIRDKDSRREKESSSEKDNRREKGHSRENDSRRGKESSSEKDSRREKGSSSEKDKRREKESSSEKDKRREKESSSEKDKRREKESSSEKEKRREKESSRENDKRKKNDNLKNKEVSKKSVDKYHDKKSNKSYSSSDRSKPIDKPKNRSETKYWEEKIASPIAVKEEMVSPVTVKNEIVTSDEDDSVDHDQFVQRDSSPGVDSKKNSESSRVKSSSSKSHSSIKDKERSVLTVVKEEDGVKKKDKKKKPASKKKGEESIDSFSERAGVKYSPRPPGRVSDCLESCLTPLHCPCGGGWSWLSLSLPPLPRISVQIRDEASRCWSLVRPGYITSPVLSSAGYLIRPEFSSQSNGAPSRGEHPPFRHLRRRPYQRASFAEALGMVDPMVKKKSTHKTLPLGASGSGRAGGGSGSKLVGSSKHQDSPQNPDIKPSGSKRHRDSPRSPDIKPSGSIRHRDSPRSPEIGPTSFSKQYLDSPTSPEYTLANTLVVLSSTVEDGEIEVRISPHSGGELALLAPSVKLAPLEMDVDLDSMLPMISPNYRPLGHYPGLESPTQKKNRMLTDEEALSKVMYAKNQRTKVYSGVKTNKSWHKVPSLYDLCIRLLIENIDAMDYTGGVPFDLLEPVLKHATAQQLFTLEHYNPYLIEDTNQLWTFHVNKEFRTKPRQEFETSRDMYIATGADYDLNHHKPSQSQPTKLGANWPDPLPSLFVFGPNQYPVFCLHLTWFPLRFNLTPTRLFSSRRCVEEREEKLKALTSNIQLSIAKSTPVRQTKLAYVDSVAKPPRNVARKQAKYGTANSSRPESSPTKGPRPLGAPTSSTAVPVPVPIPRGVAEYTTWVEESEPRLFCSCNFSSPLSPLIPLPIETAAAYLLNKEGDRENKERS
uniref:TFIIS N-terminal domain-containing protein n=1 Tax=Timema genevievae TaxID=629358 RepID=A0A7R9PNX1_TIMGE|nr:unnamed protein product [Timema genevievae]